DPTCHGGKSMSSIVMAMDGHVPVSEFEEPRPRLTSVAYRLTGWLTTVVARICLDMLRLRASRREDPLEWAVGEPAVSDTTEADPEGQAVLADSIGLALLVVLGTLTPSERVAFVLHDMFGVPFDEVGAIVGRSSTAARQLASRARRRVQGADAVAEGDIGRRREIVEAFLSASRGGDFEALLALLDPDVVLRADAVGVRMGAEAEVAGAAAVAATFAGRAKAVRPALLDGVPGAVWSHAGSTRMIFGFTIADGKITGIEMIADSERISQCDVEMLAR
ncbi:MAG: sigma factor-like helix-turn-helix DNA-binding protein, partial [Streptosporangiaceae bacterium]